MGSLELTASNQKPGRTSNALVKWVLERDCERSSSRDVTDGLDLQRQPVQVTLLAVGVDGDIFIFQLLRAVFTWCIG